MAIQAGYYNSVDGDRKYNAETMSKYFTGIISRGVLQNYKEKFAVTAYNGMSIKIPTGRAFFSDGKWVENTADIILTLDASDVVLNRIDRIVLRSDRSTNVRNTTVVIKKGTPAATPTAPALQNDEMVEELSLATIQVNKLVESITQANITNTIPDTTVCGYVTGLIEQVDTSDLYSQYEAAYQEFQEESQQEFDEWFQTVKETLSTVTLIRQYRDVVTTTQNNQTTIPINIPNYNYALDIVEVYINGLRLTSEEYTTDHNTITLTKPLDIGQPVEVVTYKSVDGTETETVVEQVEVLQEQMARIEKYIYYATGENDNTKLTQIVQDFYNAAGTFINAGQYDQLHIDVVGNLSVTTPVSGTGVASDPYIYFNFNRPAIYRKVTVDFANASRIVLNTNQNVTVFAADRTTIKNLQMTLTAPATGGTLAAIRATDALLENITADITAQVLGIGFSGTGEIRNGYFVVKSETGNTQAVSVGNGLLKVVGCRLYAYKKATSATAAAIYTAGASTSCILMATNNYIPAATLSGYTQDKAIHCMVGKYILTGNAVFVATSKTGATGEEIASLII